MLSVSNKTRLLDIQAANFIVSSCTGIERGECVTETEFLRRSITNQISRYLALLNGENRDFRNLTRLMAEVETLHAALARRGKILKDLSQIRRLLRNSRMVWWL